MTGLKIGFALCGSFCTIDKAIIQMEKLIEESAEVIPIMSEIVQSSSTRFGDAESREKRIIEITQKEIYTTEKYLYEKALRKVAIIISRKGSDESAKKAARGSLRELGKLIVCLSDEDVNKLIDMKNNKEEPADYLEALLDDMLMDLEK